MAVDSIGDSQTAELAAKGLHSKLGQEIEDVNLDGWPQFPYAGSKKVLRTTRTPAVVDRW